MKAFDKDVQDRLQELTELYLIVKEIVIYSEENNPENKANIQVITEFRNAFDHLMRVYAAYFEIERVYDSEYVKLNLNKAFAHVYRAGYDTLDMTTLFLKQYIAKELEPFSLKTINSVFPDYYKDIRPSIEEIKDEIGKKRGEKDVGDSNCENFQKYANLMKTLKGHHIKILKKKSALIEYENKLKKEEKEKEGKNLIRMILAAIAGAIVSGIIIYWIGA